MRATTNCETDSRGANDLARRLRARSRTRLLFPARILQSPHAQFWHEVESIFTETTLPAGGYPQNNLIRLLVSGCFPSEVGENVFEDENKNGTQPPLPLCHPSYGC